MSDPKTFTPNIDDAAGAVQRALSQAAIHMNGPAMAIDVQALRDHFDRVYAWLSHIEKCQIEIAAQGQAANTNGAEKRAN
jgi:predicted transcriptional regulator